MEREKELLEIIERVDADKKAVLTPLIADIVYMEGSLQELRKLPFIRIHPKDMARQQVTPAAKQYKETMQAYLNAVKVVLTALYRNEGDGADELLAKLKEFEIS